MNRTSGMKLSRAVGGRTDGRMHGTAGPEPEGGIAERPTGLKEPSGADRDQGQHNGDSAGSLEGSIPAYAQPPGEPGQFAIPPGDSHESEQAEAVDKVEPVVVAAGRPAVPLSHRLADAPHSFPQHLGGQRALPNVIHRGFPDGIP